MKVKIRKTGEIVEVSTARANYWMRMGFAVAVSDKQSANVPEQPKEPESASKVVKTEPAKKAVNKKKPTKKAAK